MFCLQSWNVSHAVFQVRIKNVTSKEDCLPVRLARTYVKYDYNRYASNWKLISYAFLKNTFTAMNICVICFIKKCGVMVDRRTKKTLKTCASACTPRCDSNTCTFCCNTPNCNEGIMHHFLPFVCVGMRFE